MSVVAFNHTLLGPFLGVQVSPLVTQFRSIPYATYPERFRQSVIKTSYGQDERNFTEFGFSCPQLVNDNPLVNPSGGPIPGELPYRSDEHKCLIVTVTVPNTALSQPNSYGTSKKSLPVMAYIHGGGLVEGNAALGGQRDQKYNVDLSVQDKQPIISVNIQYVKHFNPQILRLSLADIASIGLASLDHRIS